MYVHSGMKKCMSLKGERGRGGIPRKCEGIPFCTVEIKAFVGSCHLGC